jgi:hypothetical protein
MLQIFVFIFEIDIGVVICSLTISKADIWAQRKIKHYCTGLPTLGHIPGILCFWHGPLGFSLYEEIICKFIKRTCEITK